MAIQNDIFFYICFMAKIYTLDQALNIVFDDREYYLNLDEKLRSNLRVYKKRFSENKLNVETKIKIIEEYGGKVNVDIKVIFE